MLRRYEPLGEAQYVNSGHLRRNNAPMPMPARLDASPGCSPSRRLRVSELV